LIASGGREILLPAMLVLQQKLQIPNRKKQEGPDKETQEAQRRTP
jgi:hypothetical protein